MAAKTPTAAQVSTMNFAELMKLARQLKVKGRGTARLEQLRTGVLAALPAPAPAYAAPVAVVEPVLVAGGGWAEWDGSDYQDAPAAEFIETLVGRVRVGSVIVASSWLGGNQTFTVLGVSDDIKNGYAGWDAEGRWGYADQVVRVRTY